MPSKPKVVHGDDLLYRFLSDLFAEDDGAYGQVPQLMLSSMAIWLPLEIYAKFPVLLPWVVRDPTCRGRGGTADQWGAANSSGYFRDDNSMIKGLPRSLPIRAPRQSHLNGRRMATEFVAAHIWRECADGGPLASRRPLLNSFLPNLVWLPGQVAKLTDREGSVVQKALQSFSWQIYRHAKVGPALERVVEEAWDLLPEPETVAAIDPHALNWFVTNERFLATREQRLATVIDALERIALGQALDAKVISGRYTEGLPGVTKEARDSLANHLRRFTTPKPDSATTPT